jgi:hypothetical protein
MSRASRFFGVLLALGAAVVTVTLGQTGVGRLTIVITNVVEEPIVDYEKVRVPVAPAAGATSTVSVICYCGPALLLSVQDCGTNFVRVESSTDLKNWSAFPQPGFQLTPSWIQGEFQKNTVKAGLFRRASNGKILQRSQQVCRAHFDHYPGTFERSHPCW